LKYPIEVFNVDGTLKKQGTITKYTWLDLTINGQTRTHNLLVTRLEKQKIIVGYPWFKQTNLDINWKKCTLIWQTKQDERKHLNQQSKMRLIQKIGKIILSIGLKNWTKTWKRDTFDRLNLPKHHLSSLSRRRMEDCDHVRLSVPE
jgi:hypothetical protein